MQGRTPKDVREYIAELEQANRDLVALVERERRAAAASARFWAILSLALVVVGAASWIGPLAG